MRACMLACLFACLFACLLVSLHACLLEHPIKIHENKSALERNFISSIGLRENYGIFVQRLQADYK